MGRLKTWDVRGLDVASKNKRGKWGEGDSLKKSRSRPLVRRGGSAALVCRNHQQKKKKEEGKERLTITSSSPAEENVESRDMEDFPLKKRLTSTKGRRPLPLRQSENTDLKGFSHRGAKIKAGGSQVSVITGRERGKT